MSDATCDNCKFGGNRCRRNAPPFPVAPGWCGEHQFDPEALTEPLQAEIEYSRGHLWREMLYRWIDAGRPPYGEMTIPTITAEDEATFQAAQANAFGGLK